MDGQKTVKARVLEMLQRLPEDIDFDRVIESIYVLQKVEAALDDVRQGEVYEDDDVMDEVLSHHAAQTNVGSRGEG